VELAGDTPPAPRVRLANLLTERGHLDEAEAHLAQVLRAHPDDAHALLGKGKLAMAQGRLPEALAALQRSAANPQTARASTALIATIQQRLGHAEEAAEASRRAASLPSDPPMPDPFVNETAALQTGMQTWLTQADRLLKSGRKAEAVALNEKTGAAYPDAAIAWQMLGQARIEAKDYGRAEQALLRAVELAPDSAESHFQLGSVRFLAGRTAEAIEAFRRSIALRPNYAPGYFNLGLSLAGEGKRAEAMEAFRVAVKLDAAFADAHRQLGAMLALEGQFAEAIASLTRAVELNPSDAAAAQMLDRARLRIEERQ
jgi:superkiller protein 3